MDAPPPPPPPAQAPRRSISLTVACAVAFMDAVQGFSFSYGPDFRRWGILLGAPWLPTFVLCTSLLKMPFLIALWLRMRKWALWGFFAVAAVQNATFLWLHGWGVWLLVTPLLVAGAAVWNWSRLR